ncbi:plasmid recombination protein [Staphylococcus aureus]|nr:plasmid recombination protein [Staphylococcus aureus]MCC1111644.1 plasmid recombination protein [Staphylococcus aureus]MCC1130122.1 plasmid recombination protein [Staphylococcus aureus]MCC1402179.1 plasmid recombination protein [Staphylococcus aureus]
MSYSIIRVVKVKSKTNTRGIQRHIQRENKNYENIDIDLSKSYLNYDLVNDTKFDFNKKIDEKIEKNYKGKRKIRTDAIKHIDGLITSDNVFFNQLSEEETKQFFKHAKAFLEEEYGKENLLYATVHMDEITPHMHYGVVPITKDGRLSAKEVVGNKKALTEFQDRFNTYINKQGYDLKRGISRQLTKEKHDQVSRYKQKTEYHKQMYMREKQIEAHLKQENDELIQNYQKSLDMLKKPLSVIYEIETKNIGGWFHKEKQETGNIVITKTDFEKYTKQIKAAQMILDDYEWIKSVKSLKKAEKQNESLVNELTSVHMENEKLVEEFNDLAQRYNYLLSENEKKDKELNYTLKLFNQVFKIIKSMMKEERYHTLINHIDNHLDNSKIREVMTIDNNDEQFFKKKYQAQEREIIFKEDREDGYTL